MRQLEPNGYIIIARRDRDDGRIGGGVIIFALCSLADALTTVMISTVSERIWCILHSSFGPLLLCGWYRPPNRGEVDSILSFVEEFKHLKHQAISTIVFGDMNVHQLRLLTHSRENTPEGNMLHSFAVENGFSEVIKQPTRSIYLLDLFLTDFTGAYKTRVLPSISDHMCTQMSIGTHIPQAISRPTETWNYGAANLEVNVS